MTSIPSNITREQQIEYIMTTFDFKRVHDAMTKLNWTWSGSESVPSIRELKVTARKCLEGLGGDCTGWSTGGFGAFLDRYGYRALYFSVESVDSVHLVS